MTVSKPLLPPKKDNKSAKLRKKHLLCHLYLKRDLFAINFLGKKITHPQKSSFTTDELERLISSLVSDRQIRVQNLAGSSVKAVNDFQRISGIVSFLVSDIYKDNQIEEVRIERDLNALWQGLIIFIQLKSQSIEFIHQSQTKGLQYQEQWDICVKLSVKFGPFSLRKINKEVQFSIFLDLNQVAQGSPDRQQHHGSILNSGHQALQNNQTSPSNGFQRTQTYSHGTIRLDPFKR